MTSNFKNQQKRIGQIEERIRTAKTLLKIMQEDQDQTDEVQALAEQLRAEIKNCEIARLVALGTP